MVDWIASFEGRPVHVTVGPSDIPVSYAETAGAKNRVALRLLASTQMLTFDVKVAGLTGRPLEVATFTQAQLIRDQNIQYVWTWKDAQTVQRLAARACFALAFENDEIAIFRVDQTCRG